LWLAIVSPDAEGAKVNLRAPIVINPESMRGVQVLEGDQAYPLDYRLTAG
jgi:flagellar assembly factor FliW